MEHTLEGNALPLSNLSRQISKYINVMEDNKKPYIKVLADEKLTFNEFLILILNGSFPISYLLLMTFLYVKQANIKWTHAFKQEKK